MTTQVAGVDYALGSTITTLLGKSYAARLITLPCTARLDTISIWANSAAGNLRLGLYTADGTVSSTKCGPNRLLAETASAVMGANNNTLAVQTPIVLPSASYWIAFQTDSNAAVMNSATGTGNASYNYALGYAAFDATFNTGATGSTSFFQTYASFTVVGETNKAEPTVFAGPGVRMRGRERGY